MTTDAVEDSLVSVRPPSSGGAADDEDTARDAGASFEETTGQFDPDEALDRL